jgi:hypothetical protein
MPKYYSNETLRATPDLAAPGDAGKVEKWPCEKLCPTFPKKSESQSNNENQDDNENDPSTTD